ncbi:MAG: hypothetical protein K1X64_02905 [Myxococcaceae bacterium]|nr:hypothetical protein [Myxococcaceae bacterium]
MRAFFLATALMVSGFAFAADKTYQVTGPVLEVRDDAVVVQKGKDKWTIKKGSAKVEGDLKVGAKVTIEYTMTAESISVKGK